MYDCFFRPGRGRTSQCNHNDAREAFSRKNLQLIQGGSQSPCRVRTDDPLLASAGGAGLAGRLSLEHGHFGDARRKCPYGAGVLERLKPEPHGLEMLVASGG